MARPPASPEEREEKRRRIRQAASEIYREQGATGISARAIADRAGVSPGTIYSYFGSLPDLMRSLWTAPVAVANERLAAIAEQVDSPVERLEALLRGYVDFVLDNPAVHRSALLYVRPESVPEPNEITPITELPFHGLLHGTVAAGIDTGELRQGDADEITQTLWAGVHGALALPVNMERYDTLEPKQLADAMIATLLAAVSVQD